MSIPTKRCNNGFEMPIYGLGTWRMGGDSRRDPSNDDKRDLRAIESAVEHGVKHIDSAEMYAAGYAEELVGRAVGRFDRSSLFLASKFSPQHASAADVVAAAEASLRRLKTDYLDLYLMHAFSSVIPLAETMGALDKLVERELVRNIGVSNFGPTNLENAIAAASNPIVVNQVHYNLSVREVETAGLLQSCRDNDVLLMAWRPVQFDGLTQVAVVQRLVEKYQKTAVQIAINWLVSQNGVITLARTSDDSHLEENLGALEWQMDDDDIELLRREYPDQALVSPAVPLDS